MHVPLIIQEISMTQILKYKFYLIILISALYSCGNKPGGNISELNDLPPIDPDYSGITIPYNIAPLNFKINQDAKAYFVRFSSGGKSVIETGTRNGIISIPQEKWSKLLGSNKGNDLKIDIFLKDKKGNWSKYNTITDFIAAEPIDPYISYRLLYPGYESWKEISIRQRSIESFKETSIIENSVVDQNCINCHSFNNGRSDDFLFHMRGSFGGTYFFRDGEFKKYNLKTDAMKNGAVYPRWHPSGNYVAFSSNRIVQQFHSALNKKVEVSDLESSLFIYDVEKNIMLDANLPEKEKYMDTYPEWSPDGRWLYFCRAPLAGENFEYQEIHYDLFRVPFDPATRHTGEPELVFNASEQGKSVSFPRISPDGRFMVITLHDYGCFPIWHKEADLWSIDLDSLKAYPLSLNSDRTDSYHSWSSNGRWMLFSSKRIDGLTTRPFISYMDENGNSAKPFIMPQKDPEFYHRFLKSYNIPEFSLVKIRVGPGKIRRSAGMPAVQAGMPGN